MSCNATFIRAQGQQSAQSDRQATDKTPRSFSVATASSRTHRFFSRLVHTHRLRHGCLLRGLLLRQERQPDRKRQSVGGQLDIARTTDDKASRPFDQKIENGGFPKKAAAALLLTADIKNEDPA